jgi:hypothetical protein
MATPVRTGGNGRSCLFRTGRLCEDTKADSELVIGIGVSKSNCSTAQRDSLFPKLEMRTKATWRS